MVFFFQDQWQPELILLQFEEIVAFAFVTEAGDAFSQVIYTTPVLDKMGTKLT